MKSTLTKTFITAGLGLMAANAIATTRYVDLNNPNPVLPYTSWSTAATNIQHAVNFAVAGDLILVTNGVYEVGSQSEVFSGTIPARVSIPLSITVRSVNGPAVTTIKGYQLPGTTNGNGAIRCVYLGNSAVLSGFTLTNGASGGFDTAGPSVGGVKCQSTTATVTNCIITGNAGYGGGGATSGTLVNCVLANNWSSGGAGGAAQSILIGCIITNNTSGYRGGGASGSSLTNCLVRWNSAPTAYGGGCDGSTLVNCTVVNNSAKQYGGGAEGCTLINTIVYSNSIGGAVYPTLTNHSNTLLAYNSCTTPLPGTGANNFSVAPLFTDLAGGNLRLQEASPCRDTGTNLISLPAKDFDGRPRLIGSRVDVGAYEFQGTNMSQFLGWLQANNLPTDASSDYADADSDGANNWQEWTAGTQPTDASSVFRMLSTSADVIGLDVTWSSVNGKSYWVERATDLSGFSTVASNLVGQPVTTTFSDTSATNSGTFFYRVGVK